MKVLITGVAGFLGSHLADAMLKDGHTVVGIDNMIGGDRDNIPDAIGLDFYQMDCQQLVHNPIVMRQVDLVYHCAALAYEGLSVFSPHTVVESIVGASTAVFSAAIQANVKRIVHCSSMARYGAGQPPFEEWHLTYPQDPYGIAKVAAEKILINLCDTHETEYVIAVPHNIIGPRQKYDDPFRNVASIMMNRMLQGKQPIIYGDGRQQRCFSFIDDCLSCLVKMGFQKDVVGHVINIGPDEQPITINELANEVASVTNFFNLQPIYMPGRPQEVKIALCSSKKARKLLGYQTKTTLYKGLTKMADAMIKRGPRPFQYHLPIEIQRPYCPKTWTDRIF
jgi:UDP-glucose 4-epimerase